ncbi:MAG: hypothetical protein JRM73_04330, partial [Nitrososphaerota archaeon]|nr:hypothetical protein [Nitrososphaerota archaeon]
IHIEFIRREGPPEPYSGRYMFQFMNEQETGKYAHILASNFPSLYPHEKLEEWMKERLVKED